MGIMDYPMMIEDVKTKNLNLLSIFTGISMKSREWQLHGQSQL